MTGRIFTADHHVYDLPPLLSWNVRHTGTVPCDSWSVTAVYQPEMLTVLRMAAGFAAIENGMTQLRGIVDEYTVELGSRGMTVTLSGRGYAARLLDNESRPVTYEQVTLRELLRCHAEPYGISCGAAADLRSTVPYTAEAGISQWKVISEFCRTYGGFLPRFAKTGELLATPEQDSGKRIILDSGSPVLNCRILRGEGEFAGPGAYEEFKALAAVFQEPGAGMLTHPVWRTDRAYFVSLSVTE